MKIISGSRRRCHVARISTFFIVVALIAGMVGCEPLPPAQEIRDWYDLDAVRDNPGGSYLLMNDLDSTTAGYEDLASPIANGGKGWEPIGIEVYPSIDDPFTGTFDGQGYEISDLCINRVDEWELGLFGYVEGGRIKDTGVVNVTVTGKGEVGGLVGENYGTVSNSYTKGSVTGTQRVGGLVGLNRKTISNSYSTGNNTGNSGVGGLVGMNWETISNSYATGNVTGDEYVGGLVGVNSGTLSNSYSIGNITGNSTVGGLVGFNDFDAAVSNSYAKGSVTGDELVGGLMGCNLGTVSNSYAISSVTGDECVGGLIGGHAGTVSDSYSTGNVTGYENFGGLVGYNDEGTVSNSFWDTQTSGQSTSDGGTGKTTTEMQDFTTFSSAGWNIIVVTLNQTNPTYIWNIVNGLTYPFLRWQS
jgi:hypothetical protein